MSRSIPFSVLGCRSCASSTKSATGLPARATRLEQLALAPLALGGDPRLLVTREIVDERRDQRRHGGARLVDREAARDDDLPLLGDLALEAVEERRLAHADRPGDGDEAASSEPAAQGASDLAVRLGL
jgi:hypothetical protein